MFETFQATTADLQAILDGIEIAYSPELEFIFAAKNLLQDLQVITFDSKHIYLFSASDLDQSPILKGRLNVYQFQHGIKIEDKAYRGWQTQFRFQELKAYIPEKVTGKFISGGPLSAFLASQVALDKPNNPYTTKESYLATIVHEIGHVHYDKHNLTNYSDKQESLNILNNAKSLFAGAETQIGALRVPTDRRMSELFAFCTDYSAAAIFWPQHKLDIDVFLADLLTKIISREELLDLAKEDSNLINEHIFAATIGRQLIEKYPKTWPQEILKGYTF